jgi:hypothetical protein
MLRQPVEFDLALGEPGPEGARALEASRADDCATPRSTVVPNYRVVVCGAVGRDLEKTNRQGFSCT